LDVILPRRTAASPAETSPASARLGEALSVTGVVHAYSGATAVDDVSFDVPAGGVAAILGPSGCGKSTMLRIISGLVTPTVGVVRLGARDVTRMPARERRVGMVFQNYALFPHMTVRENVGYGLSGLKGADKRAEVDKLLALVRLEKFADRLPRQMSGGQQQRVAVARALAPRPTLLLLDEPFAALDRALRADMQFEFLRLQRELGITTILVTHDQEEAQAVADRLIVMNAGKVEQAGSPSELYDRPKTLFVNTFVGQASLIKASVAAESESASTLRLSTGDEIDLPRRSGFMRGAKIVLAVRPEHVVLHEEPAPGAIPARRMMAVPQGPLRLHDLLLADGTPLKAAERRAPGASDAPPGGTVHVTFEIDHCRLYPSP
jgi:putative spermidine/putrescine transport system ATP-binding protein